MTADDFERELERRLRGIEVPQDVEGRLVEASRAWVPAAARKQRKTRRIAVIAAIGLALSGGTAAALTLWDPFQWGLSVPASEPAAREIAKSPVLANAPWLRQSEGSPEIDRVPPVPSLVFPPDTSYRQALEALFQSVVEEGALPPQTRLGAPLPLGVTWSPGRGESPPMLDLRAPWGYTLPEGRIRTPTYSLPGSLTADAASAVVQAVEEGEPLGEALPPGVAVDVPPLARCQLANTEREGCPFQ